MKIRSILRSRKLAAALLVAFFAYAAIVTFLPKGIALRPYSGPLFILFAAFLTAATATCAWERSAFSWRLWRSVGVVTEDTRRRLRESPTERICTNYGSAEEALARANEAMRGLRLSVRSGPVLTEGRGGSLGLLGSPLFHWALVGLFVAVAVGQVTRYEGYVNLARSQHAVDEPGSYGLLVRGPFARFTGATIEVLDIDADFVADGVERGVVPKVRMRDSSGGERSDWVYSNNPLRFGSVLVHNRESGDSVLGFVTIAGQAQKRPVAVHFAATDRVGVYAGGFHVADASVGPTMTVLLAPERGQRVAVLRKGADKSTAALLAEGESLDLGRGVTFTVQRLTTHVQLIVVNDPSVLWVYASLALATLGAAISAFIPPRIVRVLAVTNDDEHVALNVLVTARRHDPAFSGRVIRALRERLDSGQDAEEDAE